MKHLRKGGGVRFWLALFLYSVGKLPLVKLAPVISGIAQKIDGLRKGYETEFEHGIYNENLSKLKTNFSASDNKDFSKFYDFVIIGSGPGAAVAADLLPRNSSCLIIEKGKLSNLSNSPHHSLSHVKEEFSKGGQEFILASGLPQFAQGSVLGGGSEVNAGLFHELPDFIKHNFLSKISVDLELWNQSEKYIRSLLRISRKNLDENLSLIHRGAVSLGLEHENIPRWRKYTSDSHFEHFGMTSLVWKELSNNENFNFLLGTEVIKIEPFEEKVSINIKVDGEVKRINTKKVIVAAGSIETPYLLARSGLLNWSDTNFQWHPMLRVIAKTRKFDLGFGDLDPIQAWEKDYSLKYGSAVSSPGLLSVGLGRVLSPKETQFLRSYYVSFASTGRGGLIPRTKIPWYRFSEEDRSLKIKGIKKLEELIAAGGGKIMSDKKNRDKYSTVHIFGTLPIKSEIYKEGTCVLSKYQNVFICDGSILPFGPTVNPQAIIMSTVRSKLLHSINELYGQ